MLYVRTRIFSAAYGAFLICAAAGYCVLAIVEFGCTIMTLAPMIVTFCIPGVHIHIVYKRNIAALGSAVSTYCWIIAIGNMRIIIDLFIAFCAYIPVMSRIAIPNIIIIGMLDVVTGIICAAYRAFTCIGRSGTISGVCVFPSHVTDAALLPVMSGIGLIVFPIDIVVVNVAARISGFACSAFRRSAVSAVFSLIEISAAYRAYVPMF